ncbi:pupal cuticle protein Edg-84A-like [Macrobrachium nipponense]|uniref:pupal cuticle protein Edg-84A-like n=1 Tax=Macrobrachium nipponense TaxID=159736 RepID=UPI0030C7D278
MTSKIVTLLVILQMITAFPHSTGPSFQYGFESAYKKEPKPYSFNYRIQDKCQSSHYSHKERSDGKRVYGSYTVDLPDGRTQTVDYVANHHRGFVAKVTYKGKARHPRAHSPSATFSTSYHEYH